MSLLQISKDTIALVGGLENDALKGLKSYQSYWFVFLDVMATQFDSLSSVITLLEKKMYKDCFDLVRSVLEGYFFLLLMMRGKRYRETREFRVTPTTSRDPKIARDRTMEKWRKGWKSGDHRYSKVISINPKGDDTISVTIEDEGLYERGDEKRKGQLVTKYYFAFDEYDPETRFVATLPSIREGDPFRELTKEILGRQKIIYHQYFYIQNIVRNLKLNNLLDEEQTDRFWVHYNFLSMFAHPTKPGNPRRGKKEYPGSYPPEEVEEAYEELILSYVCKLQSLLIKSVAEFFKSVNPDADIKKYEDRARQLEAELDDFWFIYNDPTDFDIKKSQYLKNGATQMGHKVDPNIIVYYRNPLKRLIDLRRSMRMPYKK